jgi:hypothetical protein
MMCQLKSNLSLGPHAAALAEAIALKPATGMEVSIPCLQQLLYTSMAQIAAPMLQRLPQYATRSMQLANSKSRPCTATRGTYGTATDCAAKANCSTKHAAAPWRAEPLAATQLWADHLLLQATHMCRWAMALTGPKLGFSSV